MNLVKYIATIGDQKAAKQFGVKERIIASWRRLERAPGLSNTTRIIKASKGEVEYEDILSHRRELADKKRNGTNADHTGFKRTRRKG